MNSRIIPAALAAGLLVVALAGCAGPAAEPSSPPAASESAPADPTPSTSASDDDDDSGSDDAGALAVADSSLGEIVVDGEGMTVYMFDNDTRGGDSSSCEGDCAANWPAVTTDGDDEPDVEGVTGEVGTITGVDGSTHVTLNGWPLYTFAGDSAPGDVAGQGVNEVWWVLSPDGERMAE